jgi:hypothetical protein
LQEALNRRAAYDSAVRFAETIVAVLVGGALTFVSALLLDRRRERAAQAREHHEAGLELRVASRLLRGELLDGMAAMEGVLIDGRWPSFPAPVEQWRLHANTIARGLDHATWAQIAIAYGRVLEFNQGAEMNGTGELSQRDIDQIEDHLLEISPAERSLLHAGGDAPEVAAFAASELARIDREKSQPPE